MRVVAVAGAAFHSERYRKAEQTEEAEPTKMARYLARVGYTLV
jgi:hypothetical protein